MSGNFDFLNLLLEGNTFLTINQLDVVWQIFMTQYSVVRLGTRFKDVFTVEQVLTGRARFSKSFEWLLAEPPWPGVRILIPSNVTDAIFLVSCEQKVNEAKIHHHHSMTYQLLEPSTVKKIDGFSSKVFKFCQEY